MWQEYPYAAFFELENTENIVFIYLLLLTQVLWPDSAPFHPYPIGYARRATARAARQPFAHMTTVATFRNLSAVLFPE